MTKFVKTALTIYLAAFCVLLLDVGCHLQLQELFGFQTSKLPPEIYRGITGIVLHGALIAIGIAVTLGIWSPNDPPFGKSVIVFIAVCFMAAMTGYVAAYHTGEETMATVALVWSRFTHPSHVVNVVAKIHKPKTNISTGSIERPAQHQADPEFDSDLVGWLKWKVAGIRPPDTGVAISGRQ